MVLSPVGQRDYYEILGIPRDANADAITAAFHQLARRYHPDQSKESDAEDRFKEITEAYTVLSDPDKRAEYDAARIAEEYPFGQPGRNHSFTVGPSLDADVLNRLFLRRRGGARSRTGSDIRLEVEIPLGAVASATEQTVEYSRLFTCTACQGRGARAGTSLRLCPACGGSGQPLQTLRHDEATPTEDTACERCGGTGLVVDQECPTCGGGGLCPGREWLKVRIPPGVEDGTVLRVRGQGLPGPMPGDKMGDLYLVVRTAPDPDFVRSGPDLWHRESISVADAALGVHRDIVCLGQTIRIDVLPGTQPGTVLRLANRGLPRLHARGEGDRGDLHVVVDVAVPTTLSSTERDLYEQLRGAPRRSRRWPWRRKLRPSSDPPTA